MDNGTKRAAYALFTLVVLAGACGGLSQTAVNAMMSDIVTEFGVDVGLGQWLTTGYMLVLGIAVPAATWMTQRFSPRQHVLIGLGFFLAGALLSMVAPNFWVLLGGRVLQAVSTGVLMPFMTTIAMVNFPPGRQATAMGIAGVAMGFAPNIGPTVGGAMVYAWGWRSFFVLLVAISVVLMVCTLAFVARTRALNGKARLDAASLTLSTLGFGGVLLGLSNASSFALQSPFVWLPLLAGVLFCVLFVRRQRRIPEPLIDLGIFKSARFNAGMMVQNLLFASFMGITLVVPLYIEGACGGTALEAGMVLLPGTVAALVLNPLAGVLTDKFGPRRVCLVGGACLALGAVSMCVLDESSPLWLAMVLQGIRACGVSTLVGPLIQWSLSTLPGPLVPHGSSFSTAARQACASFGTAAMVFAIAVGKDMVAAGASVALPYQMAFGFSAAVAVLTFAGIAWKVR